MRVPDSRGDLEFLRQQMRRSTMCVSITTKCPHGLLIGPDERCFLCEPLDADEAFEEDLEATFQESRRLRGRLREVGHKVAQIKLN
jgi:hypothetical protein